jgi:peptide/nickel transport system permease protein
MNMNTQAKKRSQWADVWRRLKKSNTAVMGLILIVIFLCLAIFAPFIADYEEDALAMNVRQRLQAPTVEHWFGTDEFGRDIFARIVYGTRISLFVGVISVSIALSLGGTLGAIAGYYGGKIDNIIMRALDVLLAIPTILLAITIVAALGASILNLMIAVGVSNIPGFARVVRAAVLSVKDQEFIEAAKAIGARDHVIILRHVLPNSMAPIIVYATLKVASAIMATSSLSFIGLGIQPPTPEWGSMLAGGRAYIRDHMYIVLYPGLAIVLTVLSLNLIGDGLRDALDPKLK